MKISLPLQVAGRVAAMLWAVAFGLMLASVFLAGCGSGGGNRTAPVPSPVSNDAFRPNFLGDLRQANYWSNKTVTYQFVELGEAKSLAGTTLINQRITDEQRELTIRAFRQWQEASAVPGLGETSHAPRIVFREATAGEAADIRIIVQDDSAFDGDFMGVTSWYLPRGQEMGVALIRIRASLTGEKFHAVILHEIGHAWGCDGHDRQLWSVMYPTLRLWVPNTSLGERDGNSISANYARDATRAAQTPAVTSNIIHEIECVLSNKHNNPQ